MSWEWNSVISLYWSSFRAQLDWFGVNRIDYPLKVSSGSEWSRNESLNSCAAPLAAHLNWDFSQFQTNDWMKVRICGTSAETFMSLCPILYVFVVSTFGNKRYIFRTCHTLQVWVDFILFQFYVIETKTTPNKTVKKSNNFVCQFDNDSNQNPHTLLFDLWWKYRLVHDLLCYWHEKPKVNSESKISFLIAFRTALQSTVPRTTFSAGH